MDKKRESEALFWCSLLHDALFDRIPRGGLHKYLCKLAAKPVRHLNGEYKCPSVSTLKRKLAAYKGGCFDAVKRKLRSDRGKPRSVPQAVVNRAIAVKCDQPLRSPAMINQILQTEYSKTIAESTLYRYLKQAGATRRKLGVIKEPVRKRWSTAHPNEMWIGDVSHGPRVLIGGIASSTRLSAFIDVHSRYIVAGRYYLNEKLTALYDTLLRGFARHGLPMALYVDNAKIYHSNSFKAACYRLKINLLHRKVRDPEGGGLIERFFQTAQQQFESELAGKAISLDDLNQGFCAWLEVVYHQTEHRETQATPLIRYKENAPPPRRVDHGVLTEAFFESKRRTVDKTFSDITLARKLYRVDQKLRGDRVEVRYDPFGAMDEVLIYDLRGAYLGKGVAHQRQSGEQPLVNAGPNQIDVIGILRAKQQNLRKMEAVDYKAALTARPWPFEAFLSCFAELLGRKGSTSAFDEAEMSALQIVYRAHPRLTRAFLKRAFARANSRNIPDIVYELQKEEE